MKAPALILFLSFFLASCTGSLPFKLLSGGGPNVAANTQIGRTNTQTIGKTDITEQKLVLPEARPESISQSADNFVVNEAPTWLIIAFAVALFLDSPLRWPEQIYRGITGKRNQV